MTRYRVAITRDGSPDGYVGAPTGDLNPTIRRLYEASIYKNAEAMKDQMQRMHNQSREFLIAKGEEPGPALTYSVEEQ